MIMKRAAACRSYISLLILVFFPVFASPSMAGKDSDATPPGENPIRAVCSIEKPVPVYNGPQAGGYFLIRFFQLFISPQDGPNCRHTPVCSAYGRDAVKKYGFFFGSVMTGDRLLRCNPYREPMNDPVPENLSDTNLSERRVR